MSRVLRSLRDLSEYLSGQGLDETNRGDATWEPGLIVSRGDPGSELGRRGVEVRVVSNLWRLHDEVARSTLGYSMIRMRKAAPASEHRVVRCEA